MDVENRSEFIFALVFILAGAYALFMLILPNM